LKKKQFEIEDDLFNIKKLIEDKQSQIKNKIIVKKDEKYEKIDNVQRNL
jgi:hypothetical protein